MWKWFHQFAKPERLYPLCGRLIPWFGGGAIICLAV
ncbi:heme ABC transporter permease, partial [Yersinia pestis]